MFRKDLIDLLAGRRLSLHEIAELVEEPPREVEENLRHLLKSLKHGPYRAVLEPAQCRHCGFRFKDDKLHKPGKCPRCQGTWIEPPRLGIESR